MLIPILSSEINQDPCGNGLVMRYISDESKRLLFSLVEGLKGFTLILDCISFLFLLEYYPYPSLCLIVVQSSWRNDSAVSALFVD